MKKKSNKERTDSSARGSGSFFSMMAVYLIVCSIGMAVLVGIFNSLIKKHDRKLTGEVCSLVTEKMNNSIKYMTSSVQDMSALLSAQEHSDPEEIYSSLSGKLDDESNFLSIGFIGSDGKVYANDYELSEFVKWGLTDVAKSADPVSISAPYRSGLTGQPVITLFTGFTYGSGEEGYLFVTYPLREIQEIAYTESLSEDTEIWLMNSESDNIIHCASSNPYQIGSWSNALLTMKEINRGDRDKYENWKRKMEQGITTATVTYSIDTESYTQVYSKIDYMHGWNVVVRIPSKALSSTIDTFRRTVMVYITLLVVLTLLMFITAHLRDSRDKKRLKTLSDKDPLTGVMNRRAFDIAAERYIKDMDNGTSVMLFLDIDYFKKVNDLFGHEKGDEVLKLFSDELKRLFDDKAFISRYGGDEFVVLIREVASTAKVNSLLDQLKGSFSGRELTEGDKSFTLSFSAGAAVYPKDAPDLKELTACADTALYNTKKNGRNGYSWYKR
ncbi:MAG: GGDEF domain-containing protein [Ruminococcus sp.]|nr:GGDEF domain-containing protein [Ruminococcus sp.]